MRHFPGHQDDVSEYLLCSQNQNDVHSNQLQKRNRKKKPNPEANYFHVSCGGSHQLISAQDEIPYNQGGFHSSWGKAASFILGNITIHQKLLI